MAFPLSRPRRLRRTEALRRLTRETRLSVDQLIYPLFVDAGIDSPLEVASMPGVRRWSLGSVVDAAGEAVDLGVPAVLLFGLPETKDEAGSGAFDQDGIVQQATRALKRAFPDLLLVADTCVCEYTSHGHCGVLAGEGDPDVLNDPTLDLLARTAVSQARAGADVIAPSDMMDGRVGAIRRALDEEGFQHIPILSYAAKYASAFYGPFRDAADSAPQFGDRRTYQMDPPNVREALREIALDLEEGRGRGDGQAGPGLPRRDPRRAGAFRGPPRRLQRQRGVRHGQGRRRQRLAGRAPGDPGAAHRDRARRGGHGHHLPRPGGGPVARVSDVRASHAGYTQSEALFEEAQRHLPGGVNSPVRAFKGVGGTPLFIERGAGSRIWDADGNEYVDYVGSWGPLIAGHAHPEVVQAVRRAAERGTSYGAPTEAEVRLAALVKEAVPSIELVRFVNSGTEATMSAIRAARGFTGREVVIKFDGGYHGHADGLLVQAGSGPLTLGAPDSPGVPAGAAAATLSLPFNDLSAVGAALDGHAGAGGRRDRGAGGRQHGRGAPRPRLPAGAARPLHPHGALLILDEVMTGFRVAWGGAQARFGVTPDLTTLGKIVGGGLPVGAYGGRREVMERIAPLGPGLPGGDPLREPPGDGRRAGHPGDRAPAGAYERLEALSARLEAGLARAAAG